MKKGQIVKCVKCPDGEFTVGKEYEVLGAKGDIDRSHVGEFLSPTIINSGLNLKTDHGTIVYARFPSGLFGTFELVK